MKHIIIGHVAGIPFYYDHPNGNFLSMTLGSKMAFAHTITGDHWKLIRTANALFVFANCGNLHFLILSDEGDSENYLKYQIQFLQDLLVVKYGPKVFNRTLSNTTKNLVSLFNNAKKLFRKEQSFLLGATERLEVGDDKLTFIIAFLKRILNSYGIPQIRNVLITIGTKVLINYPMPKLSKALPVDEIQLILTFIQSHYTPMAEDFVPRAYQAADYRNHDNVKNSYQYNKDYFDNSSERESGEEEYVSCDSGNDCSPDSCQESGESLKPFV